MVKSGPFRIELTVLFFRVSLSVLVVCVFIILSLFSSPAQRIMLAIVITLCQAVNNLKISTTLQPLDILKPDFVKWLSGCLP